MIPRYTRPEMAGIWTDENRFKIWLKVETLALEAMVELGVAPKESLEAVKERGGFSTERILEIEAEVKHDVIAFLTNVAEHVGEEARYLHFGMTSSDLLDTSFSFQLLLASDLILASLDKLQSNIKAQAIKYKETLCVGRSHGIHAEPTTFGLKLCGWYDELKSQKRRLLFAKQEAAVGAVSGPVGTFAHLSPKVEEYVCEKLGLQCAGHSTQVIGRDRYAALFCAYAQLAGSLEKISVEVRHLQRTEVREAEEPFTVGQKGSSAMPHKRNPVLTENITGLARLVRTMASSSLENIALWHERDISHSSVERVIAPDMTTALHFMIERLNGVVKDMRVYPENMKRNLELTRGLVFSGTLLVALAAKGLSREEAYRLVQSHALATWDVINEVDAEADFEQRVKGDKQIAQLLGEKELSEIFSYDRHIENVDYIFSRVFE